MDTAFIYSHSVSGRNFIGRKGDVTILSNLISQEENVALYGPPKCGKTSLLGQAMMQVRMSVPDCLTAEASLLSVRSLKDFACTLGDAVLRAFCSTPAEFAETVSVMLKDTHFVFDANRFADYDEILSLNWDIDLEDAAAVIRLPYLLSSAAGRKLVVLVDDFQCIAAVPDYEILLKKWESVIREQRSALLQPVCSFVFSGSALNAMKYLFLERKYFWKLCERFTPSPIGEKEAVEYITRSLMVSGKVVENDLLLGVYKLFRGDIWYINHFMSVCDHLTKGYIMEPVLMEALSSLTAIHEPRFKAVMADLTTFQVNLLQAILDGNTRFSAAEIISKYSLSSSANVKRLKDALVKKEIVTFDDKDEPMVIDPLFEYWARKYFFGERVGL